VGLVSLGQHLVEGACDLVVARLLLQVEHVAQHLAQEVLARGRGRGRLGLGVGGQVEHPAQKFVEKGNRLRVLIGIDHAVAGIQGAQVHHGTSHKGGGQPPGRPIRSGSFY
jgi:hypothetical protein